jgi:integrase
VRFGLRRLHESVGGAEILLSGSYIALIRACGRGPAGIRDARLIATMYGAGLRVSEALALRPSDFDLTNGTVRVKHGKGDRSRTVAIEPSRVSRRLFWLVPSFDREGGSWNLSSRNRPAREHKAWEAEALGQSEVMRLVRAGLDELLTEPLAVVLEREQEQRAEWSERLAG